MSSLHFWNGWICKLFFPLLDFKILKETGLNVTYEDVPNTDHFDLIEKMVEEEYQLTKVQNTHTHTN